MSEKIEQIKKVIISVANELPQEANRFRDRIEEELKYRNICSDIEFYFDEYPSMTKKHFENVIYRELDSIDEVKCDDNYFNIYATVREYEFNAIEHNIFIEIIDTYVVRDVKPQD
jgi:hypothetical protein